MDLIFWLFRLAFVVLVLWFALQNMERVEVHLAAGQTWNVQLILVILACFVAGALAGMVSMVPLVLRLRRRISELMRSVSKQAPPVAAEVAAESLTDVARRVGAVGGIEAETRAPR
jgi:lipopolysaccharide assembly protein A